MKNNFVIFLVFLIFCCDPILAEEKSSKMEFLDNSYKSSDTVVLVSCYKSQWRPLTKKEPESVILYGMIVHVYKGQVKIGQRIQFQKFKENMPGLKPPVDQKTKDETLDGNLQFLIFDLKNCIKKNDTWVIQEEDFFRFYFEDEEIKKYFNITK